MSLESNIIFFDSWLKDNGVPEDYLNPPAEKIMLDALSLLINVLLPEDFMQFYGLHDGYSDAIFLFNRWSAMPIEQIIDTIKMSRSIYDGETSLEEWRSDWLPLFSDGGGNYLYMQIADGKIFRFDHEGGYSEFSFKSLGEIFDNITKDIIQGLYEYKNFIVGFSS